MRFLLTPDLSDFIYTYARLFNKTYKTNALSDEDFAMRKLTSAKTYSLLKLSADKVHFFFFYD